MTRFLPYRRERERERERDLAIRAFLVLRWQLRDVEGSLGTIDPSHCKQVRQRTAEVAQGLDVSTLEWEELVSGQFPTSESLQTEALKGRLADLQKRVAAITQLVNALALANTDAQLDAIDALAADAAFPQDDLATQIAQKQTGGTRTLGASPEAAPAVDPTKQLQGIVRRENRRNIVTFAVSAIVSVIVGYALVIGSDPAFGGWPKLLAAFLWGFGVTSGGTKLTEVTTGTIRTAL